MLIFRLLILTTLIFISAKLSFSEDVITYSKDIAKIVETKCYFCHGDDSPTICHFEQEKEKYVKMMKGPALTSYTFLYYYIKGERAGVLMRVLDDGKNTPDGKPGIMYVYLGSTEKERQQNLDIFKKWIGYWVIKESSAYKDDELKEIKALRE